LPGVGGTALVAGWAALALGALRQPATAHHPDGVPEDE
jgi:hypothetical protein